jgi:hypothetical protein
MTLIREERLCKIVDKKKGLLRFFKEWNEAGGEPALIKAKKIYQKLRDYTAGAILW